MKKKFIAFIHNVLRYVKLLTEQVRKGNLSKDAVNRKKETGFKNGRLLATNLTQSFWVDFFETSQKASQHFSDSIRREFRTRYYTQ